jgi:hypothetical protein
LLDVYNISKSWNWLMHTMRPVLWVLHHVQGLNLHKLHQLDHHILLQGLKRCTQLHPSYLLATTEVILPTKLVSATFLLKISFVIIVEKRDIDALPSHGVKPTWGLHKVKLRKVKLGSTLPASNSRKG